MKKLICAVVGLAATAAVAGSSSAQAVSISSDSAGQLYATGSYRATRNSSDTQSYIGCAFYSYDTGSISATCYAYSATGQYATCYTSDPNMLKVVGTLNAASSLYFVVNADGSCDRVINTNSSFGL